MVGSVFFPLPELPLLSLLLLWLLLLQWLWFCLSCCSSCLAFDLMLMSFSILQQSVIILEFLCRRSPLFMMDSTLACPQRFLGMIFFAMLLSENLLVPFAKGRVCHWLCRGTWLLVQYHVPGTWSCAPILLFSTHQFCPLQGISHWISGLSPPFFL